MGTEKCIVSVPSIFSSHPPAHPSKRADVFVRKHTYILYVSIPHCTSCASLHTGGRGFSILCAAATRSFYPGATCSAHLCGAVTANNKHPGYSDPHGMFFFELPRVLFHHHTDAHCQLNPTMLIYLSRSACSPRLTEFVPDRAPCDPYPSQMRLSGNPGASNSSR